MKGITTHSHTSRGIAVLPVVLILGTLIVIVGISLVAIAFSESLAATGERRSADALHYAEAGEQDALMRLTRDRDYLCDTVDCYSIDFATSGCTTATACAWVRVRTGSTTGARIITSRGRSGINERIIERDFTFDTPNYGAVAAPSWQELAQ